MIEDNLFSETASKVLLPDGSSIYQHKEGQRVSSDNESLNSLLFQKFKSDNKNLKVLELGAGNGINSIMLKKRFSSWNITGIEIDLELAQLAEYNCRLLDLNIIILNADLRKYSGQSKFDLIIANPPFKDPAKARLSPSMRTNIAKFEIMCSMFDIFQALSRNLANTGQAYLLYSIDREDDLKRLSKKFGFEIFDEIKENKIIICGLQYVANK